MKHSKPKKKRCGVATKKCLVCGKYGAHINKYGLHLCRQCFRDIALDLGFKKYGQEV